MMHNHQLELLEALVEEKAIVGFNSSQTVNPQAIDEAITSIEKQAIKPLNIPKDNNIFEKILDSGKYD
jgi:UDP-N-acetylglucosamine transferase subunit ALG13